MLPYWLLFSVYAFGAMNQPLLPRSDVSRSSYGFLVMAVLMALFVGLRYRVGADWFNYTEIYSNAARLSGDSLLGYADPAYAALNVLGQWLDVDIWFVNLICALIFVWGVVKFAERQPNPWLAVAVAVPYLVIVVGMGYTRQAAAIGLALACFGPFERGRYVYFMILVTFAAAFHKSAIVVLPLIALSTVRHRFVVYATAGAMGALIFFLFLEAFLSQLLADYFESERTSEGAGIRVAMNVLPALIYLGFSGRFVVSEQEKVIWRNFALASLAMVAGLFLLPSSTLVDRAALYMMPIQIFVLSRVPYAFPTGRKANGLLIAAVLAYSATIQFVWLSYAKHAEAWLPYQFTPLFGRGS